MSLVAYDASSDEDDEPVPTPPRTAALLGHVPSVEAVAQRTSALAGISQPSSSGLKAVKSSSGKIQILAPSFENLDSSSDDDEDRPKLRNLKPSEKGSGLRSMLPPARGCQSEVVFAPRPMTHKTPAASPAISLSAPAPVASSLTSLVPHSVKRKTSESSLDAKKRKDEDDDVVIEGSNFFSFVEDASDSSMQTDAVADRLPLPINMIPKVESEPVPLPHDLPSPVASVPAPAANLSEIQLKKMISHQFGDSNVDQIELMDVNVKDHLLQNKEYLKTLSTEKDTADRDAPQPNPTVRRKHHITYLAHQAKQRELALKEEWARNKATRNQSRAKYGF